MALNGTLQNFAGGVMILLFIPFGVGDLIETKGYTGVVKEIQIFVTILLTPENKTVILPNGAVANGEITNYATEGTIRVDITFGIGYGDSIEQAKRILYDLMENHEKILDYPPHLWAWLTGGFFRQFGRKAVYKTARLLGRLFLPL